jgi:hypothetical protein
MIKNLILKYPYQLAGAWGALIFALCAMPGMYIPAVSWLELLSFDKWVHAGIFFILVWLLAIAVLLQKQKKKLIHLFVVLSIIYGGLLELMQAKVFSNRSADWQDFVANSFGCLMALFFYKQSSRWLFK